MVNLLLTKTIDSEYLLNRAKKDYDEAKAAGVKIKQLFIVPDRIVVSYQMLILEALEIEGSTNIEVCSFRNLADNILGREAVNSLNQQTETMLIRKVIEDNKSNLEYFKNSAKYPGFAVEMIRLITTLRANGINPDSLGNLINSVSDKYKNKIHDIQLLLSAYLKELDEREDYISKLEKLKNYIHAYNDPSDDTVKEFKYADYNIYVAEFFNFSQIELNILKEMFNNDALTRKYIAIPYSENDNSYIFPNYLKSKFESMFANLKIEEFYKEEKLGKEEYEHIQSELFGFNKISRTKKSEEIEIQVANNIENEVKALASNIKLLIHNGARYKDIACICCDVPTYTDTIASIFKKYDIPYFTDVKAQLIDQKITKILMLALKIKLNKSFLQADVFALLKAFGDVIAKRDDINRFENYCLKNGIEFNKFENKIEEDKVLEDIRIKLLNLLKPLDFTEATNVKEMIVAIRAFLDKIDAKKICEDLATQQQAEKMEIESSVTLQSYKKLNQILEQLENERMLGECKMAKDVFIKVFEATLLSVTITTIPMYIDCVYVGDLQKSRYEKKDYIFIIGANEALFPQDIQESSILTSQDLNVWEQCGKLSIFPTIKDSNRQSKLNVLMALLKAKKKLVVSYPIQDMEGEELKRASAIDSLCKIIGQVDKDGEPEPVSIDTPNDNWDEKHYVRFVGASKNALESLIAIRKSIDDNLLHESDLTKKVCNALYQMAVKELKDKNMVDDILKGSHELEEKISVDWDLIGDTISPSRLESYLGCPFRYYLQYVLRLKKREEFGVDIADTGNIIHECFEKFFSLPDYDQKNEKQIYDFVVATIANIIDREEYRYLNNEEFKIVLDDLKNETSKSISTLVEKMKTSLFKPYALEAVIGEGEDAKFKPLEIDLGTGKKIKLTGKIDRIDTNNEEAFIVDYKSKSKSSAKIAMKDIVFGNKIQIIVYLDTLTKNGGKVPVGAFYLPLSSKVSSDSKEDRIQYVGFVADSTKTLLDMDTSMSEMEKDKESSLFPFKCKITKAASTYVNKSGNTMIAKEDFMAIFDYVEDLSANVVKEINAGNIKVAPQSDNAKEAYRCKYCDYKSICKIDDSPEKIRCINADNDELLEKVRERYRGKQANS